MQQNPPSIAIIGASGMVGQKFAQILEERNLTISRLYLFASARSAGKTLMFHGQAIAIEELTPSVFTRGIDYALFAVDSDISKKYAPIAADAGCVVIDNSSAWRMDASVPLVVPEVNSADLAAHSGIVANPNCCATPSVVALKPLADRYGLARVVISTYQSVSGAGVDGMADLAHTGAGGTPQFFPHIIAGNLIPHIDTFHPDGYTGEEKKLIAEIRKMLHMEELPVTATTVRVPVEYGHSLSINVTLQNAFDLAEVRDLLGGSPGVVLQDNPEENMYPTPLHAAGTDDVYIGRVRRDDSFENSLNMWVVADNTRKGAATNAVQVLESLLKLHR